MEIPENYTQTQYDLETESSEDSRVAANRIYLWAAILPIALLGLALVLGKAPLPQPLQNNAGNPLASFAGSGSGITVSATGQFVLPVSETYIVSRQSTAGYVLLRGRMQPPLGMTITAPTNGEVAQVSVRPGQAVQPGQEIVEISTGTAIVPQNLPPVQSGRTARAEAAQVAALKRQRVWQEKVRDAHARLEKAQARVQAAQVRVAEARDLVRRLQSGEDVSASSSNADSSAKSTPEPSRARKRSSREIAAQREAIIRQSQKMQQDADDAARVAASARRAALAAERIADSKQKQAQDAKSAAGKIETPSSSANKSTPSGSDEKDAADFAAARKQSAQAKADSLKADADAAQTRAVSLRRDATRLADRATSLQTKANDASRSAADALQNLKVFDNENSTRGVSESTSRVVQDASNGSSGKMSVGEAVRIARTALDESRDAIADAERIRREVESYERPVENTRENFDAATRRLNAAQEQIFNRAGAGSFKRNVRSVGTPSAGIVLWVAEAAREVSAGDAVAAVGRADRMEVVLQDYSQAWKSAKPGSTVLAWVQGTPGDFANSRNFETTGSSPAAPHPAALSNPPAASGTVRGVPTLARVLAVRPPQKPGDPAYLRIAIHNPRRPDARASDYGLTARSWAPGTTVMCSLAQPGGAEMIAVPSVAIRREAKGLSYVAVLAPVIDAQSDTNADLCRIEWRKVKVGRGDGFQNPILAGLEVGDRIALRPDIVHNFTLAHGQQATLQVEQA
jgi:hypothetical protein